MCLGTNASLFRRLLHPIWLERTNQCLAHIFCVLWEDMKHVFSLKMLGAGLVLQLWLQVICIDLIMQGTIQVFNFNCGKLYAKVGWVNGFSTLPKYLQNLPCIQDTQVFNRGPFLDWQHPKTEID